MVTTNQIFIIICAVISVGLLIWILLRMYKKHKIKVKKESQIPQEVLDDFQELERRIKQSDGRQTAQEIIWQYTREREQRKLNNIQQLEGGQDKYAIEIAQQVSKDYSRRDEGRGASTSTRQFQSTEDTGARRTTYRALPANQDIRGDRELVRGKDIQIQSDINNPKDKRKSKIDWTNFS
jgi:hypothetical protein